MASRVTAVTAVAAAATFACLGGCYERVVRAEGPSAYKYDVHEPNLRHDGWANELADDVFGSGESKDEGQ